MSLDQTLLDGIPGGAVKLRGATVVAFNQGARTWLPELVEGEPAPEALNMLCAGEHPVGAILLKGRSCLFSRIPIEDSFLILLQERPAANLSEQQMDGVLLQLREQMNDMMANLDSLALQMDKRTRAQLDPINQRFYQMLRLVGNIEFLKGEGMEFRPTAMDFAGFCRQLTAEVAPLLREVGISLHFQSDTISLLITGDAALLRKMILGLISNSAQAARNGRIMLNLSRLGERAVLSVSDTGQIASQRQLALLLTGQGNQPVPAPGEGAGLGLPVVRRVVELHKGSFLIRRRGTGGLEATVALPTGMAEGSLSVKSPVIERSGGYSPLLVELADILPPRVFHDEDGTQ